jgi:hypothetical protein
VFAAKVATDVPAWAWGAILLLVASMGAALWWIVKRWINRVGKKMELLDRLPCVIDSKKLGSYIKQIEDTGDYPLICGHSLRKVGDGGKKKERRNVR